jgi:hypothetical protein
MPQECGFRTYPNRQEGATHMNFNLDYEQQEVMFLVKTYPCPSKKYDELVCTAAITEDKRFIRIYPVMFRDLPKNQQFKKYEWVKVGIAKSDTDSRLESYKVDYDSIKPTGKIVKDWQGRMQLVKPFIHSSLAALEQNNMSLGIIKPKKICDMDYEEDNEDWQEGDAYKCFQWNLEEIVRGYKKPELIKIPYRFRYKFHDGKDHHIVIRDWELFALFLKYHNEGMESKKAAEIVRDKFFNKICSNKNDVYFIVGTQHRYKTWLILGVMYPPKGTPLVSVEDYL